tara:strand:- start:148 stop:678 length:531 start_codon:yes stop_codon:yes gene_type:complete
MKTGDVIGFSGKGDVSNVIKQFTGCDISHIGIVYRTPEDRVVIMESTSLNDIPDCVTGERIKGVQQQYLSDRLASYDGQAYWYALDADVEDFEPMFDWLEQVHENRTEYDTAQAIGAGIDYFVPENHECLNKLFCSELVSHALQLAGVVPDEINASEETPADVIKYPCLLERKQIG